MATVILGKIGFFVLKRLSAVGDCGSPFGVVLRIGVISVSASNCRTNGGPK